MEKEEEEEEDTCVATWEVIVAVKKKGETVLQERGTGVQKKVVA